MKRIVAVNSNSYHGYTIEEAIDGISKAGFKYIELTATKGWTEHVFPTMSLNRLYEIKEKLDAAGLIPFAMSGHCNLMDTARIGDFIANMRLAAFFGCEYIVSSIGEAHIEDKAVASNEEVAEHIRALLPKLEEYGLKLALEVHGDHGTGVILKQIADLVNSPLVGVNYDTANALFYGDVVLQKDIAACVGSINYVHLKDKAGERTEWNFPALGQGYIDFPAIVSQLEEANNNSPFSIEIEFTQAGPKDVEEVNRAVEDSYKYLRSIGVQI
ncbi:MAG: sugar phosphate isomerase/epimerase family protein [Oscillospiraceae bacterium]